MKLAQETLNATENLRDMDVTEMVNVLRTKNIVWSWGARGWTNHRNRIIAFRVSGRKFSGNVAIMCNASDLMDIHFCSNRGNLKHKIENVFIGDMISQIDEYVEKVEAYAY